MKKFNLSVVEVRAFVPGMDDPFVTPTHFEIVSGNSPKEVIAGLQGYLENNDASITESNEEARYIKIDMEHLVLECEFASDDQKGLDTIMKFIEENY